MAEQFTGADKRTKYCGEFTASDIGSRACVCGWVQRQRDLGSLIFIDLRDRSGIVQLAFDDQTDRALFDTAFGIRAEYVLCAKGTVRARGEGAVLVRQAAAAPAVAPAALNTAVAGGD